VSRVCLQPIFSPAIVHSFNPGWHRTDQFLLVLGICSLTHYDLVAYVRTGRCLIQPAATATLSCQNLTICAILQKQGLTGRALGRVLDSDAQ